MALKDTNQDYDDNLDIWLTMRDVVAGEKAIKDYSRREIYLPNFVPDQGIDRYDAYINRAIYVNYTGETEKRLLGAIFRKPATYVLPQQLEYMLEDCTGNGLGLEQFAKVICSDILVVSRSGIMVDFPDAEKSTGSTLVPTFSRYPVESIYNWRSKWIDGKEYLTQVRLKEEIEVEVDEFTTKYEDQYRVLDIEPETGYYRQRIYNNAANLISEFYPRANGSLLKKIPFFFVGSENNRSSIGVPPLYDLGVINLGHYRNSADYEDSVHTHGQGTVFLSSDLSTDQFKEANPNGIKMGSRAGHFLGPNGKAELLQMESNMAAYEAMSQKEEQMKAFGAEMFDFKGQSQTAEEARIRATSEANSLNLVVGNVSSAIEDALEMAALFIGADDSIIEYQLNNEFFPITITADDARMLKELKDSGVIALSDLRNKLRKTEIISPDRTDEEIDKDIKNNGQVLTTYETNVI